MATRQREMKPPRSPRYCLRSRVSPGVYPFPLDTIDFTEVRARLCKMTDDELLVFGRAARTLSSPAANPAEPLQESFLMQFQEARAQWRRRHPLSPKFR